MKPFLRWAGGKTWFVNRLPVLLPSSYNNYYEPFLGGGAVFFNLQPIKGGVISDINKELINSYIQIRDNLDALLSILDSLIISEKNYYKVRSWKPVCGLEHAARFIYLNRTCFNGIYRVNLNGNFNVPYGKNDKVVLYNEKHLKQIQKKLKQVNIRHCDFEESLKNVGAGDLVFIDPPYTVAHNHNGFVEYNQKIFSWDDQLRLSKCIRRLKEVGAHYIVTNAMHESLLDLYNNLGSVVEIPRHSTIGGQMKSRKKISELVLTNCI